MGRYTKPKTPPEVRFCKHCNTEVESEEHFIMNCNLYNNERAALFTELSSSSVFDTLGLDEKFKFIMSYNMGDTELLLHITKYVNVCMAKRKFC